MKHSYTLTGMTCAGCEDIVKRLLSGVKGVLKVKTSLAGHRAEIEMNREIPLEDLQKALAEKSSYQISELN